MVRTKIVVLDGGTLNPGDLSWDALKAMGDCDVYENTPPELVVQRARGAHVAITNKIVLDRKVLEALADLRYIGVTATGYNIVDVQTARQRGVVVTNVPTYATQAVAQFAMALLLELCHHAGHHSRTVFDGRWAKSPDFCYWDFPLVELDGLTMGLVGLGRIGLATARLAQAFGMKTIAHEIAPPPAAEGIEFVSLDDLFKRSDVVSLHCPLTDQTRSLVNRQRLALMKPTALLINTSRGPLVNEADLAEALNAGSIAGAAVDVLSAEPPRQGSPLLSAKNCIITPHIAWAARSARQRLMNTAVANVRAFIEGKPVNVVNP
jgi:glycerate dehydrogenase